MVSIDIKFTSIYRHALSSVIAWARTITLISCHLESGMHSKVEMYSES